MRVPLIVRLLLSTSALLAISASQAWTAPCVTPPVSPKAVLDFKADPQALVAPNTDARVLEVSVRDLAGTDPSLAADLVNLAKGAPPKLQTAIAAGLAQAAIACTNVDQQAGLLIQQAVANFQDGQFQASFEAVAGDLSTAATDAAASSAASSVGSVVVVNPNTGGKAATNPGGGGGNAPLVQITLGTTAINAVNTPPTSSTTATAANPVSPIR
jgi:hypothetical protein